MSTSVTVLKAPTVAVTVTASPATPSVNQVVTFTATATPGTGATVTSYDWSFGDNTGTTTSGSSASHVYTTSGSMTVTVTARTNLGTSGTGQTIVTVTPQVPINVTLTASANPGYVFLNWTENGIPVSSDANYIFTCDAGRVLEANFIAQPTLHLDPGAPGTLIISWPASATKGVFLPVDSGRKFCLMPSSGFNFSTDPTGRFI